VTSEESEQHHADHDISSDEPGQEGVRRLLAAAGDPAPLPEDVAHRLDDVLAGLVAARAGSAAATTTGSSVPSLAERRARRWPRLLVAAAVVSVVGLGVSNVLEGTSTSQSDTTASGDAGGAADADGQGDRLAREAAPADSGAEEKGTAKDRRGEVAARLAVPALSSASLATDAQRVADLPVAVLLSAQRENRVGRCAAPPADRGDQLVDVRLDGAPATLVLRAAGNGFRLAEVYACGNAAHPVASTSVAAD